MGTASKVFSVLFRVGELICAAIVTGILSRYLYLLDLADVGAGSRIIYSEVIGGLSIAFSIILMPPLTYSFILFPLDFALFICWMVAFGLLTNLTIGGTCSSYWFWYDWGYYWGRFWYTTPHGAITAVTVDSAGCGRWRCALAFSFVGGFIWLASTCVGLYVTFRLVEKRETARLRNSAPEEKLPRAAGVVEKET